jgi:alpha-glucosidase
MFGLLLTLKGTTLIYQGEELGLPEAQSLTREEIRDPVGDLYWPIAKGRDGSRTPMPWAPGAHLGFSPAKPWLPSAPEHAGLTVAAQEADAGSMLAFSRAMIALRRGSAALTRGEIGMVEAPEPILAFTRTEGDDAVLCVFNMSGEAQSFADPRLKGATIAAPGAGVAALAGVTLSLGPHAFRILELA